MRVAHVANYRPDSADGVKSVVAALARALPDAGVEVELWHFDGRLERTAVREPDGVTVFDVPQPASSGRTLLGLPSEAAAFVRERVRHVDLVHLHSAFAPINLAVARHVPRYVVTPHNGYHPRVLEGRKAAVKRVWMPLLDAPYLRRALFVQAANAAEADAVRRWAPRARIEIVPNGVPPEVLAIPVEPPSRGGPWLFLGRLDTAAKGLDLLLSAYAGVAREPGVPDLVLAGPDFRDQRVRLERLARDVGVADRVRFLGPVYGEEKLRLVAGARAVLQPSRWEGMSLALLEALALGRPVLVTPGTNLRATVDDAGAGVGVDGTVDGVVAGLRRLAAATGAESDAMGARARALVDENFTWPAVARRLAAAYRSVADDEAATDAATRDEVTA